MLHGGGKRGVDGECVDHIKRNPPGLYFYYG
jgi:hypothetical protein